MNKQLFALSLLGSASLLANCSCCTSCCCPEPTECVSDFAYTAPVFDLQCDRGLFLEVDFLYWYARETDLSYGAKIALKQINNDPTLNGAGAPVKYEYLKAKWDPGFRVALGWNRDCDGWDVWIGYSWLYNQKISTSSSPLDTLFPASFGETTLLNPWINSSFSAIDLGPRFFDRIQATWRLRWNVLDLELGRHYWLSPCFNMRLFTGIRGAWWQVLFETLANKTFQASSNFNAGQYQFKDEYESSCWGGGLVGGIQPTWYFSCDFALYGQLSGSLIWGDIQVKKKERYLADNTSLDSNVDNSIDFSNHFRGCFSQMTPILDLGLGLRWERNWCCDRYRTTWDLGWEHHVYFDENHRLKTMDNFSNAFKSYAVESGNLGLGGFVLRCRFDF